MKSNLGQRSSAPAILESGTVTTNANRLSEPAILGGSQNSPANHLAVKSIKSQTRSPKSQRKLKLAPFKRFEKRANEVVPGENDTTLANGFVLKQRKSSSNDELATNSLTASTPSHMIVVVMHRKMVCLS